MGAGELSGGGGKGGNTPTRSMLRAVSVSWGGGGGVMVAVIPRVSRGLLGSSTDLAFFLSLSATKFKERRQRNALNN